MKIVENSVEEYKYHHHNNMKQQQYCVAKDIHRNRQIET